MHISSHSYLPAEKGGGAGLQLLPTHSDLMYLHSQLLSCAVSCNSSLA